MILPSSCRAKEAAISVGIAKIGGHQSARAEGLVQPSVAVVAVSAKSYFASSSPVPIPATTFPAANELAVGLQDQRVCRMLRFMSVVTSPPPRNEGSRIARGERGRSLLGLGRGSLRYPGTCARLCGKRQRQYSRCDQNGSFEFPTISASFYP